VLAAATARAVRQGRCAGRPGSRGVVWRRASSIWDIDEEAQGDDVLGALGAARPRSGETSVFEEGAKLSTAVMANATRYVAVAPWNEDVKAKPIFVASDSTGAAASCLAETAFCQFGSPDKVGVEVAPGVRSEQAVRDVVARAAAMAPPGSLAVEKKGAFLLYTLASRRLSKLMAEECHRRGVPCIDALEPVLAAMERRLGPRRSPAPEGASAEGRGARTVFAVSDGSGSNVCQAVRAALRQFPGHGVGDLTVCSGVSTVEEVAQIVGTAQAVQSLVVFTFASPGISRFMRMQCERLQVPYADFFQPVLMAFEKYLDYPPVCVRGGHKIDLDAESPFERWQLRRATPP